MENPSSISFVKTMVLSCFDSEERGAGNGYVAVPPTHPLYGKTDFEIFEANCLHVAGELSLAMNADAARKLLECVPDSVPGDWWIIGFDTMCMGMTTANWPMARVIEETKKMKEQIDSMVA